jgi:hypothetical protein
MLGYQGSHVVFGDSIGRFKIPAANVHALAGGAVGALCNCT